MHGCFLLSKEKCICLKKRFKTKERANPFFFSIYNHYVLFVLAVQLFFCFIMEEEFCKKTKQKKL